MIIGITGTPGTGKTSVSEHFEDEYRVINIREFLEERNLGSEEEGEIEVEPGRVVEELEKEIRGGEDVVIEGHLSHHFPADYCIVLRCHPKTLESRLENRDYPRQKIEENAESEALDQVLIEAVDQQEKIIEIDTSGRAAESVAEEIKTRIRENDTGYGEVDWSDWL